MTGLDRKTRGRTAGDIQGECMTTDLEGKGRGWREIILLYNGGIFLLFQSSAISRPVFAAVVHTCFTFKRNSE